MKKLSDVKQWLYNNYIYQSGLAMLMEDKNLLKQLENEFKIDFKKSDELIIKEYKIQLKKEQLEKDFE